MNKEGNTIKYNGNVHSNTNQEILRELVNREVIMCGTDIVEYSLRNCYNTTDAPFTLEDIENYYRRVCPKCNCDLEEIDKDELEVEHKWICEECGEYFDTKEDAINCCYANEEDREELEESDIIREAWVCPFCEYEYDTEEEAKDCSCHDRETLYKCTSCDKYVLESYTEEDTNEAYEWWFVSGWFANKLLEHGEMVIQNGHNVWGRGGTGQAILLDWVVAQIAIEMEILEGQANDWSKKD